MLTTLKKSKDTLYVNIWNKMDLYPLEEECLQAMVRGTHAFMDIISYLTIRVGRMLKVRRKWNMECFGFYECDRLSQH